MRGTRGERHQWQGQPGHWICKRCRVVVTGSGALDDGLCVASLTGQLDYSGSGGFVCGGCGSGRQWEYLAPPYTHGRCQCGHEGPTVPAPADYAAKARARSASPTRLDTPERVDKVPRQGRVGDLFRSTGKGRQGAQEQGGKP